MTSRNIVTIFALAGTLALAACGSKPEPGQPQSDNLAAASSEAERAAQLDAREKELADREAALALQSQRDAQATAAQAPKPAHNTAMKPRPAAETRSPPKMASVNHPPITPPKPQPVVLTVPAGAQMTIALSSDLSSRTAKQGDAVEARVASDIMVDGKVAVPSGARVMGSVTAVTSGAQQIGGVPTLGLQFDSLQLADGSRVAISGELVEQGKSDTGRDTAKILGGAAAGAILGHQVKKNDGGKIIGGLLGGAIGAVAAKKTGTEVTLPAGSTVTIALGQSFQVTQS